MTCLASVGFLSTFLFKNKINQTVGYGSTGNAPLTFPLSDERLPPRLHVQAQVFHHAVDAVVQGQAAGLGLDGLTADGTFVFLFTPLLDAVAAEAVGAVQDDCLQTISMKIQKFISL